MSYFPPFSPVLSLLLIACTPLLLCFTVRHFVFPSQLLPDYCCKVKRGERSRSLRASGNIEVRGEMYKSAHVVTLTG